MLALLRVQLALSLLGVLALFLWRRRTRSRAERLVRKDVQLLRRALGRQNAGPEAEVDLECCIDVGAPDLDRAQALRRLSKALSQPLLGELLVFMGARCGFRTCGEILRLGRHYPDPSRLTEIAQGIVDKSGSETLRVLALEALAEIGPPRILPWLKRWSLAPGLISSAAANAYQSIEARAERGPEEAGAVSIVHDQGAVSVVAAEPFAELAGSVAEPAAPDEHSERAPEDRRRPGLGG